MKLKHIFSTIVSIVFLSANLNAQEGKDPYVKKDAAKPVKKKEMAKSNVLSVTFELFSIPTVEAGKLMRERDSDHAKYDYLVENGKVESMTVLRTRSGQKSTNEAIQELIYPTEYVPAEIPNSIHIHGEEVKPDKVEKNVEGKKEVKEAQKEVDLKILTKIRTAAQATAFETRNLGLTLEIETVMHPEGAICDLMVAAEFNSYGEISTYGQGVNQTTMPKIESQRINSAVTCELNKPLLLGTMSRPPFSKNGEDLTERVWFAMVTIKPVKQ